MKTVTAQSLILNPADIELLVENISQGLNDKYDNSKGSENNFLARPAAPPVLSPVLQGGITFFQDIAKNLFFDAYVDYIGIRSYEGKERGKFDLYKDWTVDLKDKEVWLIDDIADSGETLTYLEDLAYHNGAKKVYKAALLKRHTCPIELDWCGIELKDQWVFGYGMDNPEGLGRLDSSIWQC